MTSLFSNRQLLHSVFGFFLWLGLTYVVATIGAIASVDARVFYAQLVQPVWAPPGWVFAPVWTTLYTMMAIAAWWVWKQCGFAGAGKALTLFCVQLVINALWSWLFFAWHQGALAFVDVLLLWGLIVATVAAFWRVSRLAAILLLPYLAWVTFASVLTFSVWQLNPDSL